MNYGEKIKELSSGDIWVIKDYDLPADRYKIEREISPYSKMSIWITSMELNLQYEFIERDIEAQLELPIGNNNFQLMDCRYSHDWKRYNGFREVYEYCSRCDAKREVKE